MGGYVRSILDPRPRHRYERVVLSSLERTLGDANLKTGRRSPILEPEVDKIIDQARAEMNPESGTALQPALSGSARRPLNIRLPAGRLYGSNG